MGIRFSLEHASLVGWLTRRDFPPPLSGPDFGPWPVPFWEDYYHYRRRCLEREDFQNERFEPWKAPRVARQLLQDFLEALPDSVVTRHQPYLGSLRRLAKTAREAFAPVAEEVCERKAEILPSSEVARILAPLRRWFDVPFYFLQVDGQIPFERYRDSPDYTLWLQCHDPHRETGPRDLLDPFPPLRALFSATRSAPATLCWTWNGDSALIPNEVASAEKLLNLSQEVPPWHLWSELKRLDKGEVYDFNLLQLSDPHFGASAVSPRRMAYVEQHLRDRIETVRRGGGVVQPIVTGDLMDTPSRVNLAQFEAFRNRLTDYAKTQVICIPGNHDMRERGFLWRNWEALAGLEWSSVVRSDVCKVVFACFDTSRDARLAQGKITDDQFLEVATKLAELKRTGDYSPYIFVALVHHHPFSTRDDEIDTLPILGIRGEPFLRMENGDHLVKWCAANRIPLILHGHKHRPRFVGQEIEIEGQARLVRALGCGSTLGIEERPLSFNWITWQPATRSWMVSFFADPGDGSGFAEKRLAIGAAPNQ